ncbi:uncharacterized protein LOC132746539 [Ruditapes philippinarum]|uniref:uncharacterized protein LOC132746539 n=1 Tax=Ruditapes philippinarum TaxID=129788 RepID=UPI00295AF1CA|nr:uncharacterized protein LOC132746539 [Ruditapes philippinarum]
MTISERAQNAGGRPLADRVIRSHNDSRINQRPQTYSNNESECVCCQPCRKSMELTVYILHLTVIATARFVFGLFMVGTDKVSGGVAIFEIVKGATDFIIAITLWQNVNCLDLKYFTSVLILASAILTGFGTYFILRDMLNTYYIGLYTIVDWVMIVCIIRYTYCVVKDD